MVSTAIPDSISASTPLTIRTSTISTSSFREPGRRSVRQTTTPAAWARRAAAVLISSPSSFCSRRTRAPRHRSCASRDNIRDLQVGAGNDHCAVVAIVVGYRNAHPRRRAFEYAYMAPVDACRIEAIHQKGAKVVRTDCADHSGHGPGTGGRDGLVATLATELRTPAIPGHRLALPGPIRGIDHDVVVEASDDDDGAGLFWRS